MAQSSKNLQEDVSESREQNWQSEEAVGFRRYPPALEMYWLMYDWQVWPKGGDKI